MAFVYLLKDVSDNNYYKIGVTRAKNIEKRIKQLQTGNSNEIYLVDFYETQYPFLIEKMMHNKFMNQNYLNEWFILTNDDVKQFKDNCKKCENIISSIKDNPFLELK